MSLLYVKHVNLSYICQFGYGFIVEVTILVFPNAETFVFIVLEILLCTFLCLLRKIGEFETAQNSKSIPNYNGLRI